MTDRRLDPWRDLMVRALCGELDETERAELDAAIQSQPDLQADWKELEQARAALGALAPATAETGFEFEMPPEPESAGGQRAAWWRWAVASAAGCAAAATGFLILLVAGLRIDRTPEGVLVGFASLPAATAGDAVGDSGTQVTHAELALLAQELIGATSARLDELERRQAGVQSEVARALYGALSERQQLHYDDLRTRLELATYRGQTLKQH